MDYYYDYDYGNSVNTTGLLAVGGTFYIISLAIAVFSIICTWKIYKKAGKPGWASIIPIYNVIVLLEIAELPMWYIALFFVPFANIYAIFKINIEVAKKFGKSTGFGVGMTLLSTIFYAILAFDKNALYNGTSNNQTQPVQNVEQQSIQNGKFCPNCGSQVDQNTQFCPNCGSKVM